MFLSPWGSFNPQYNNGPRGPNLDGNLQANNGGYMNPPCFNGGLNSRLQLTGVPKGRISPLQAWISFQQTSARGARFGITEGLSNSKPILGQVEPYWPNPATQEKASPLEPQQPWHCTHSTKVGRIPHEAWIKCTRHCFDLTPLWGRPTR